MTRQEFTVIAQLLDAGWGQPPMTDDRQDVYFHMLSGFDLETARWAVAFVAKTDGSAFTPSVGQLAKACANAAHERRREESRREIVARFERRTLTVAPVPEEAA